MSNLIKHIEAVQTRENRYTQPPPLLFKEICSITDELSMDEALREWCYDIQVALRTRYWIKDGPSQSSQVELAMQEAKEAIIQTIFGEFKEYFYLIRIALRDREYSKAFDLLDKFQKQMYEAT